MDTLLDQARASMPGPLIPAQVLPPNVPQALQLAAALSVQPLPMTDTKRRASSEPDCSFPWKRHCTEPLNHSFVDAQQNFSFELKHMSSRLSASLSDLNKISAKAVPPNDCENVMWESMSSSHEVACVQQAILHAGQLGEDDSALHRLIDRMLDENN